MGDNRINFSQMGDNFDSNIKQTSLISENELLCMCCDLKISSHPFLTVLVDYMDMVPCLG